MSTEGISARIAKIKSMLLSPLVPDDIREKYNRELIYLQSKRDEGKLEVLHASYDKNDDIYNIYLGRKRNFLCGYGAIGICTIHLKESRAIMEDTIYSERGRSSVHEQYSLEWMEEVYRYIPEEELIKKYDWRHALARDAFELFLLFK